MRRVGRRSLFRGLAVLGAAGIVTACSAPPPGRRRILHPSSSPSPESGPTTAPLPGISLRPDVVPSFGPNGTHYPAELPWLGDKAATEIVSECTWTDIARHVQGLTARQVDDGVVIRVKPGTLPGGGSGSSSQPALAGVGNQVWERNVLICPLEGFGSVTVASSGIRFDQCARLSFFGFQGSGGVTMTRCISLQIGWGRFGSMSITRGGRDLALYELVLGFRQDSADTVGVRPTEAYEMTNISRFGCVFGPSVKPADSDAHCDTIQLESTGTGPFGPLLTVDCVDYGSSNAAELLHDRLSLAEYRHSMILGGQLPWRVYPLRPGDYEGDPNAFAGGCRDVRLTDCVVSGAIGRMGFTQLDSTVLSYAPQPSQQPSVSGAWQVDSSVSGWSGADIMAQQAVPDYELGTLGALWTW